MQVLKQRLTHFSRGAKPIWRPPPSGAWAGRVASTPATSYCAMQPDGRAGDSRHRLQVKRAALAARRTAHQARPTATATTRVSVRAAREGCDSGAQQRARRGTERARHKLGKRPERAAEAELSKSSTHQAQAEPNRELNAAQKTRGVSGSSAEVVPQAEGAQWRQSQSCTRGVAGGQENF